MMNILWTGNLAVRECGETYHFVDGFNEVCEIPEAFTHDNIQFHHVTCCEMCNGHSHCFLFFFLV